MKTLGFSDGKVTGAGAGGGPPAPRPGRRARHARRRRRPARPEPRHRLALPPALRDGRDLAHRSGHRRRRWRSPSACRPRSGRSGSGSWTRWPATADRHRCARSTRSPGSRSSTCARCRSGWGRRWSWSSGSPGSSACWCRSSRCRRASATRSRAPGAPTASSSCAPARTPSSRAACRATPPPCSRTLPGVARDPAGRPLASAELVVMVDLPRQGETEPNNVPFRGVQPLGLRRPGRAPDRGGAALPAGAPRGDRGPEGRAPVRGARASASRIGFRDSDWTVVGHFTSGGDVHESEIWSDAEVTMSAFRREGYQSVTARLADGSADGLRGVQGLRSAATRASRSPCCGSPSTTRSRPPSCPP